MTEPIQNKTCKTCKYYARAGKHTVCCKDEIKILLYPERCNAAYYMTKANSHCGEWKAKEAKQ